MVFMMVVMCVRLFIFVIGVLGVGKMMFVDVLVM